jgi:hypothetical protein
MSHQEAQLSADQRRYPRNFMLDWAMPILDEETGKTLEYSQLSKHPKYQQVWKQSYSNELGWLCQGVGTGNKGPRKQRTEGMDTFNIIDYADIPSDQSDEIAYTKVVCEVREQKEDPNRTRITIGGNRICFPGDVGTPTASLDLLKLIIHSVLSRRNANCACFDIKTFYLMTPMDFPEHVRIKISDILQEFIDEYNLTNHTCNIWVYFEIVK